MDNTEFLTKTSEEKITEIISRIKAIIMDGGNITPAFYLFDDNDKLKVIEIEDKLLLKPERKAVVKQLVKEKIKDLNTASATIDKVLFLREGYYNPKHPEKTNMNLDEDFNKANANEALIVTIEDEYNFNLKIYDLIKIFDQGKSFSVLSEVPIEDLDFCKIDPENNVKSNYLNLIS